jgi:hypothetical protein
METERSEVPVDDDGKYKKKRAKSNIITLNIHW